MGNTPKIAGALVVAFVLGTGLGYYMVPTKIQIKTVEREVVKTKVDKVTTVSKKPDGSSTTVIVDKTTTDTDKKSETSKKVEKENKNWLAGGSVLFKRDGTMFYEVSLQRRVLGELYVGALGSTEPYLGVGLTFRF